jgi:hypothetical protein
VVEVGLGIVVWIASPETWRISEILYNKEDKEELEEEEVRKRKLEGLEKEEKRC